MRFASTSAVEVVGLGEADVELGLRDGSATGLLPELLQPAVAANAASSATAPTASRPRTNTGKG